MLYYTEVCLSPYEVPTYDALCIYISGCCNRCLNCHYPLLQEKNYGTKLLDNFSEILQLYSKQANCVCFLGEGNNTTVEHREFSEMVAFAKRHNMKTCLYSGRDTDVEKWMDIFDFIKVGGYDEKRGDLRFQTTNQKLFKKENNGYENITYLFWK